MTKWPSYGKYRVPSIARQGGEPCTPLLRQLNFNMYGPPVSFSATVQKLLALDN